MPQKNSPSDIPAILALDELEAASGVGLRDVLRIFTRRQQRPAPARRQPQATVMRPIHQCS